MQLKRGSENKDINNTLESATTNNNMAEAMVVADSRLTKLRIVRSTRLMVLNEVHKTRGGSW